LEEVITVEFPNKNMSCSLIGTASIDTGCLPNVCLLVICVYVPVFKGRNNFVTVRASHAGHQQWSWGEKDGRRRQHRMIEIKHCIW
jgi:hypothetical protein